MGVCVFGGGRMCVSEYRVFSCHSVLGLDAFSTVLYQGSIALCVFRGPRCSLVPGGLAVSC